MRATVKGVVIELTPEQIAFIEQKHKEIIKTIKSFAKVLHTFGFTSAGETVNGDKTFLHPEKGWFAEVLDYNTYQTVWMVGHGLKCSSGFPGGYTYDSPESLAEELLKAD